MVAPAVAAALLNAASTGTTTALSYAQNQKNIKFQRQTNQGNNLNAWLMARAQRKAALMDWNRENAYNSPAQQMQRLKEAGLNPHLVYGNGANVTAGSINSSSAPVAEARAPVSNMDWAQASEGVSNTIQSYQNVQLQQQQLDNMKKQAELLDMKAQEINVDIANKMTLGEKTKFTLDYQREMKDTTAEYLRLRNRNLESSTTNIGIQQQFKARELHIRQAEYELNVKKYELLNAKTTKDMERIASEILLNTLKADNISADTSNKQFDLEFNKERFKLVETDQKLRALGLTPGTPEYNKRYIQQVSQGVGVLQQVLDLFKERR